MELAKRTSLEKVDTTIKETLDWKLEQLKSKNLPVESGLADYIAFGVENIDNDISQIDNYIKQLQAEKKAKATHKTKVLEEVAEWLQGQGLAKINGVIVSSITINKGLEATETKSTNKVFENYLSEEETHQLLIDTGNGCLRDVETIETTKATQDKIKINKKRK